METLDIKKELAGNAYPGRGIVIGKSADGVHAVIAYFIMGRSVNSRNRVFVEQGDGILFDTRLTPRTEDLAFCEVCGERMLKYIRKRGRELWLLGGGTDDTLSVDGDIEALARSIRRYGRGRRGPADRIPRKGDDGMARQAEVQLRRPLRRRHHRAGRGNAEARTLSARPHGLHAKREETDNGLPSGNESRHSSNT